jgi:hypothetical protein
MLFSWIIFAIKDAFVWFAIFLHLLTDFRTRENTALFHHLVILLCYQVVLLCKQVLTVVLVILKIYYPKLWEYLL